MDVLANRDVRRPRSLVVRKKTHQKPGTGFVAGNAVHAVDIGLHDGIQVVKRLYQLVHAHQEDR